MSEYTTFLDKVYSGEGYHDFSIELEQQLNEQEAWKSFKQFNEVMIKKACEHPSCSHFKCECGLRIGGIEI